MSRTIAEQAAIEAEQVYWTIFNSPLLPTNEGIDSSFHRSFAQTLPNDGQDLKAYVEEALHKKSGEVLALELGGVGSALFAGSLSILSKKVEPYL